jgi:hypothetical protein
MLMRVENDYRTVQSKATHSRQHLHERLPCPACHFERLIDTSPKTRSLTYTEGQAGYLDADYFQKCKNCKAEIGIRKIE